MVAATIVTLSAAGGGATCPADFGGTGRTGGVSVSVTTSAKASVMQAMTMEVAARGSVFVRTHTQQAKIRHDPANR